jgi:hypothetical protein
MQCQLLPRAQHDAGIWLRRFPALQIELFCRHGGKEDFTSDPLLQPAVVSANGRYCRKSPRHPAETQQSNWIELALSTLILNQYCSEILQKSFFDSIGPTLPSQPTAQNNSY